MSTTPMSLAPEAEALQERQSWEDLVLRAPPEESRPEAAAAAAAADAPVLRPVPPAAPEIPAAPAVPEPRQGRSLSALDAAPAARRRLPRVNPSYLTHELRAPLTSIRSALSLLQERLGEKLDADECQLLRLALKNSDRLGGLINDIMDYSKLQSGKLSLDLEPVYPKAVIQEAVDGLKAWAVSKGVKVLRMQDEDPLPRVKADPRRTIQILTNLLSNAIKFTNPGGRVEVTAKIGKREHAGTVIFSVKDTGCGIPPEDRDRIFKAFEQASEGAKVSNGTGLGLTLAKAMVEMQGGRIWVESWRGLGSTFRFTIPIVPEDLAKPVRVYPKPVEYHGLLVNVFRRLNAVVAFFSL